MHCDNIGQQETAALQKQVKLVSVQAAVQEVNTVSVERSLIPKDLCIHYDVDMLKILL